MICIIIIAFHSTIPNPLNSDKGNGLPLFYQDIPELRPMLLSGVSLTGTHLGIGSFGIVEELRYGWTICAGNKLHESLMDYRDEGAGPTTDSEICV